MFYSFWFNYENTILHEYFNLTNYLQLKNQSSSRFLYIMFCNFIIFIINNNKYQHNQFWPHGFKLKTKQKKINALISALISSVLLLISLLTDYWLTAADVKQGLWRNCTLASSLPSLAYSIRATHADMNSFFICVPINKVCKSLMFEIFSPSLYVFIFLI